MKQNEKRKPGRPRSNKSHENIINAAMQLAEKMGYANVALKDIAQAAGASRQTIYRWWRSKADLYMEILRKRFNITAQRFPPANENSLREYLEVIYKDLPGYRNVALGLMCNALNDKQFQKTYLHFVTERRKYIVDVLTATAKQRGSDFPFSIDVIADMVAGTLMYRLIHQNLPLDDEVAKELDSIVKALLTFKTK